MITYKEYERLAKKTISHYCHHNGLSYSSFIRDRDYIDAAVEGLINADVKFNPTIGTSLKTYRYRGVVLALLTVKHKKQRFDILRDSKSIDAPSVQRQLVKKSTLSNYFPINLNRELVEDLMNKAELTEHQRELLTLRFSESLTYTQIARVYNCSRQNIEHTISLIIKKLRKCAIDNDIQI